MNDEIRIGTTAYTCPSCGGRIQSEATTPEGEDSPVSVAYVCTSCRKGFTEDELRDAAGGRTG